MNEKKIAVITAVAVVCAAAAAYIFTRPKAVPVVSSPSVEVVSEPSDTETVVPEQEDSNGIVFHRGFSSGIAEMDDGSLLIADTFNRVLWKVEPNGSADLYAGRMTVQDLGGQYVGGYNDAAPLESAFLSPWAVVRYAEGFYAVSDMDNHVVRILSDSQIYTGVGSGKAGLANGFGTNAVFNHPTGLAMDTEGNLYIADTGNNLIRRLDKEGNVETFAGSTAGYADGTLTSAAFNAPTGLSWSNGALYVADSGNHCIRKIENGQVTTVAGAASATANEEDTSGFYADGPVSEAMFYNPQGLAVDGDVIYVADTGNSAIRKISANKVETLILVDLQNNDTYPISPRGLLLRGNTLLITDAFSGIVFEFPLS